MLHTLASIFLSSSLFPQNRENREKMRRAILFKPVLLSRITALLCNKSRVASTHRIGKRRRIPCMFFFYVAPITAAFTSVTDPSPLPVEAVKKIFRLIISAESAADPGALSVPPVNGLHHAPCITESPKIPQRSPIEIDGFLRRSPRTRRSSLNETPPTITQNRPITQTGSLLYGLEFPACLRVSR